MRKHFVTFVSPGTFVAEQTTKPIGDWSPVEATRMSKEIVERHGAKPYAFYFTTCLVSDPVPDGEGGALNVEPKQVAKSGLHFLGGRLLNIDQITGRDDPKESILLSNMASNDWPIVVENTNSYKTVQPFEEDSVLLDADGIVATRGNDPVLVAYRAKKIAAYRARLEEMAAK